MINYLARINSLALSTLFLVTSCGLPKETVKLMDKNPKEMIELPVNYANLFPTPTFEQWDKDYNYFERYLTRDILRTQIGLSYTNNGVQTWWCMPSASTHVQLDTVTMIRDPNSIVGNWRITCNRKITYQDSVSFLDKTISRKHKINADEKDDDLLLSITNNKFKLYVKTKGADKFKTIVNKNYHIENKRYLMLYRLLKSGAGISFIGLDKEDRLIVNAYYVEERKIKNNFIVYLASMTQLIFKRMK